QVDRCTFSDFVEVHIAAKEARIARAWGCLCRAGCSCDAPEHRPERNSEVSQVLAGFVRRCGTFRQIQMPSDIFARIFHLDRQIAIQRAVDNAIVADRPVTVKAKSADMHHEYVARHCALNIERAGLRITARDAADSLSVAAARIHRGGVNRISRRDCQNGLIERGELTVEHGGREFVALRRPVVQGRHRSCGQGELVGTVRLPGIGGDHGSGENSFFNVALNVKGILVFVSGNEVNRIAAYGPFELIAIKIASELRALLLEFQAHVAGCTEEIFGDDPASGKRRRLGRSGKGGETKQTEGDHSAVHVYSCYANLGGKFPACRKVEAEASEDWLTTIIMYTVPAGSYACR